MTKEEKIKLLELELAYLENARKNGITLKSITDNQSKDSEKPQKVDKKELCPC